MSVLLLILLLLLVVVVVLVPLSLYKDIYTHIRRPRRAPARQVWRFRQTYQTS